MPEFYAEPMKDRKCCSVCKMTAKEKGKKVLLTCIKCHAITYCGVDCQSEDWERHEWNCVPVMVTEIPGKGRGLVAATDIEKGELIFVDKPVIKLAVDTEFNFVDPEFMTSLKEQIESLPSEARAQYYKLTTRDGNTYQVHLSKSDLKVLDMFVDNSKVLELNSRYCVLYLNMALVNHSCSPNATNTDVKLGKTDSDEDGNTELRAIKKICKGEEINICYFEGVQHYSSIPRKRKTALKKHMGFDCKCPVCLGHVPLQEKTLKKIIELHNKLNPTPSDWKREAGLWSRIVDFTIGLHIGDPHEKIRALEALVRFSHLARDKDLVTKAMDMMKHFAEDTKIKGMQMMYENWEMLLVKWSKEFSSNNAPRKEEIYSILN